MVTVALDLSYYTFNSRYNHNQQIYLINRLPLMSVLAPGYWSLLILTWEICMQHYCCRATRPWCAIGAAQEVFIPGASAGHWQLQHEEHTWERWLWERLQGSSIRRVNCSCEALKRWRQCRPWSAVPDRSWNDLTSCAQKPSTLARLLHDSLGASAGLPLHAQRQCGISSPRWAKLSLPKFICPIPLQF
jgi:hypothetical protein